MRVSLITEKKNNILNFSMADKRTEVFSVAVHSGNRAGECFFRIITTCHCEVWIGRYRIEEDFKLISSAERNTSCLSVNWPAGQLYPAAILAEGHAELLCTKGKGRFLVCQYYEECMKGNDGPSVLNVDESIRMVMMQILDSPYRGEMQKKYLTLKANELYILLQEQGEKVSGPERLPPFIIEKLKIIPDLLRQNPEENYTIQQLSSHLRWNATMLKKYFKCYFGETVHDYQVRSRMELAAQLLTMTSDPLKKISVSVGYKSEANFSAAFHKFYGSSPGYFRKRT